MTPNFTPIPGTVHRGIGHILATMKSLDLSRFAAGVISDLCLVEAKGNPGMIKEVIEQFLEQEGNMLSLTVGDSSLFQEIYEACVAASNMTDREAANRYLKPYAHVNVRVGGWQAPFISMSLAQQKTYLQRPIS